MTDLGPDLVYYDLRYFEMTPEHPVRVPGSERFHPGFLGRESRGEVDRRNPVALTVRNLIVCEDATQETVAVSFDRGGDPVDVRRVDSEPDDVRHASTAY